MSGLSSLGQRLARAAHRAADLVVPPACIYCRKPLAVHDALCASCWRTIKFIRPPLCDRLGIPLPFDIGGTAISAQAAASPPAYARARAVAHFDGVLRDLVHQLKYGDSHIARRLFGRWLAEAGAELLGQADLVVPVPLDRWRLLKRRFNQAAILSRELNRLTGVAWDPLVLQRTRRTVSQVGLTHDQRRRNVRGAFAVAPGRAAAIRDRAVVLLDDVITTGATAEACARALLRAGASRVDVLALCLVTPDSMINP
ncbi:MAG: ComF family protein [Hyphomicrobiaceae bacterium]|nr:ComF family protein [Hyphomicrobiaceae bacterium]